jgi:two-component system sensor histidine kinase RegB
LAHWQKLAYLKMMNLSSILVPKLNLGDENLTKATWLIRLRWAAVIVESAVTVIGGFLGYITIEQYPYYLLLIIALVVFCTASTLLIKDRSTIGINYLIAQIFFDLLHAFCFLLLMSSHHNPLIEILYLYLILIVFILPFVWNLIFYISIIGISAFFYLRSSVDHHNLHHFYSHLFTMFVIWSVLNWVISILKKYQNAFWRIQDNKNRMDRLKSIGAMSSGICHELATPLNTIKLKLSRIDRKKEYLPEDLKVAIEAIEQCESAIKKLALSTRNIDLPIEEEVSLGKIVSEIITNFSEVKFNLRIDTDKKIKVNQIILFQTLIDLIENAIEASLDKIVNIHIFEFDQFIQLEIENNGKIFPKVIIEKLGEPFLSNKENGVGLGLFNAYNFMLTSNGTLSISNLDNSIAKVILRFQA